MSAEIIPLNSPERVCSFCKTPESQAKRFVASSVTSHCICGQCIKKATERLQKEKA